MLECLMVIYEATSSLPLCILETGYNYTKLDMPSRVCEHDGLSAAEVALHHLSALHALQLTQGSFE